jgi:hypothetical protein
MSDGALWDEVVIRQEIILQGLFEFGGALEAGLLAEFADTSVETLDQARANARIDHRLIPPRHPQTNSMVEHFNDRSDLNLPAPILVLPRQT